MAEGDEARNSGTLDRPPAAGTASHPRARSTERFDLVGSSLLHFRVVERLGEGGMGIVYKAIDEKLRRPVALKVLNARYLADERNLALLFREARSAAAVAHPNIGAIHEIHDETHPPFIVMELVDGESLRDAIARGPFSAEETLRVARSIAAALSRAHASGVVHRDLKPDNVMLARDGQVKVLDFGLAKVAHEAEPTVGGEASEPNEAAGLAPTLLQSSHPTEKGRVMGTPAYMSPEQARGDVVDARTDVFAFGVVLYEMLTGSPPFERASNEPWRWGSTESGDWRPRAPLRTVRSEVPRALEAVVARCMDASAERRYADGLALVAAFDALAAPPRALSPWLVPAVATGGALALVAMWQGFATRRSRAEDLSPAASRASSALGSPPLRSRILLPRAHGPVVVSGGDVLVLEGDRVLRRPLAGDSPAVALPVPEVLRGWRVQEASSFPDPGHWLAVATRGDEEGTFEVFLDGRTGRRLGALTHGGTLSPDGKHVAYVRPGAVVVTTLEGAETLVAPAKDLSSVCWAPTSDAIALGDFNSAADLFAPVIDVMRLDGSARHRVVTDPESAGEAGWTMAWPEPRRFLYVRSGKLPNRSASIMQVDLDENAVPVGEPRVLHTMDGVVASEMLAAGESILVKSATGSDSIRIAKLSSTGDSFDTPPAVVIKDRDPYPIGWIDRDRLLFETGGEPDDRHPLHIARFDGARVTVEDFGALRPAGRFGGDLALLEDGSILSFDPDGALGCRIEHTRLDGVRDTVARWADRACPLALSCARNGARCVVRTEANGETRFTRLDPTTGALGALVTTVPATGWVRWVLAPNGRELVYAGRTHASFVDVATGATRERALAAEENFVSFAFALDGHAVYGTGLDASGYYVRRFDHAWAAQSLLTDTEAWFSGARLSPDGRTFAFYTRDFATQVDVVEPAR